MGRWLRAAEDVAGSAPAARAQDATALPRISRQSHALPGPPAYAISCHSSSAAAWDASLLRAALQGLTSVTNSVSAMFCGIVILYGDANVLIARRMMREALIVAAVHCC